jgi:aspartate aminotransferase-like enzyme
MPGFGTFFLPGPTEVRPEIMRAMTLPLIGHRSPAFEKIFARVQTGLRYVFRTVRPVFISTSSATGLMEAGVRCAPDGPMLALVNGGFSERFVRIAELTGREYERYDVAAGEVHDPEELARRLDARRFALMTVVHSETSTGALNDVEHLAEVARERGVVSVVDSVSGVGGAPFEFDKWRIDYALTGSQKVLALPPGLAFAAATPAFVATARAAQRRGLYFDLLEFEVAAAKRQTPNTPAISLIFALDAQLRAIRAEGLEKRWARHAAMRESVENWVDEMREDAGIDVAIPVAPANRSPTVTTLRLPTGVSGRAFINAVAESGFTIGSGYRQLGAGTARIGHMGDHTVKGLARCLAACGRALKQLTRS